MKRPILASALLPCLFLSSCGGNESARRDVPVVELFAAGDIMLDRSVGEAAWRNGMSWILAGFRAQISSADIAFANLESPISEKAAKLEKPISFRAPAGAAKMLSEAGFDIVSLANNHAVDCGRDGLVETMDFLKKSRIRWCGAGKNRDSAEGASVLRSRGLRVAFVAFCEFPEGSKKRDSVPTIALAEPGTVGRCIRKARERADVVVASFHWGEEYARGPSESQRELAREAVEAGASLILGHHPHVIQGLETIPAGRAGGRPALVAWSLGNFVFDQNGPRTSSGMALKIRLGKDGVDSARILPVRIEGCRPRPADEKEGAEILRVVTGLSIIGLVGPDGSLKLD
jgi:poly-gamma-glutamate capsule biosynthesis protein CapA/YwtB (metallophosphatase superfamily)